MRASAPYNECSNKKIIRCDLLMEGSDHLTECSLGGRFGYFLFFSARGGGKGNPRRREGGGVRFLLKIPGGGGGLEEGEGPRGREGVCGELGNLGGGGAKYFFFGAEMSTKFSNYETFTSYTWTRRDLSGTKKEPKPKLLSPDIFWWGGGIPREGVGAKKVRYVPRNPGNQTFLAGYPGILPGYPGSARKI